MADVRASIPGWLDAVHDERKAHDAAFAHPHDEIFGVPVRHLSLIDISRLSEMGNRFGSGEWPSFVEFKHLPQVRRDAYDLLCYLHVHQSTRTAVNMYRRYQYSRIQPDALYGALVAYFNRTYMDALGTSSAKQGKVQISYWAGMVEYVDLFAKEYGWDADKVLNMPYRQLIQLARKIVKRNNDKLPLSSVADRVVARYLDRKNRK